MIVDFAGAAGESVELRSSRHGGRNPDGARAYVGALMQFRVDAGRVPTGPGCRGSCGRCRSGPCRRRRRRKPDRTWEITIGGLFKTTWLINGRTFNPARADAFPELDTTEVWEFVNRTTVAHVMHLHHTDWYLLPATASRRRPGKTASRRPSSSSRRTDPASPATSPTTPASS